MVAIICAVRRAVIVVSFCKNKDVVTATKGIFEDCSRTKVDIRIAGRGLVCRRAIKIPDAELANVRDLLANGLDHRVS